MALRTRRSRHALSSDPSGGYQLNGRKFYSTGAPAADAIFVLAVDGAGETTSVIVPADATGLAVLDDWRGLGQRVTGSGTTILEDVAVDPLDVLPRWLDSAAPSTGTAAANLAHVAIDLGIARNAFEDAILLLRSARGQPAAVALHRLGACAAQLHGSEALFAETLGRLRAFGSTPLTVEAVQQFSLEVSIVKAHAGEVALAIGEALFDLAGEAAPDPALGLDRHWRNARTHTLHDPNRWRYLRIGDHLLNGRLPPRNRTN